MSGWNGFLRKYEIVKGLSKNSKVIKNACSELTLLLGNVFRLLFKRKAVKIMVPLLTKSKVYGEHQIKSNGVKIKYISMNAWFPNKYSKVGPS